MSISFRPATPSDIPTLLSLIHSAYRSGAGWTTEASLLAGQRITPDPLLAKISDPNGLVLLAFSSSPPSTGTTTPTPISTPNTIAAAESYVDENHDPKLVACCEVVRLGTDRAYFGLFAVSPPLQAAGIGRQVLQFAEDYAKKEWDTKIMEMSVIWTRKELISWYVRRGYRLTDEKKPFPYEELEDGQPLRDDLYFKCLEKEI